MKIRTIVPVYNEEFFLPHFLEHYSKISDSIVVLDNGSTDGSREIASLFPKVELREFSSEGYSEKAVLAALEAARMESVGKFDWCMFPDCDEFLAHRSGGDLRDLIEKSDSDVLISAGFQMIHHPSERPLNPAVSLVGQRRYGEQSYAYSKPIIMRPQADISWWPGKHRVLTGQVNVRKAWDIVLLHLEMVDFGLWVYRKTRRTLSEDNVQNGWCVDRFCKDLDFYRTSWDDYLSRATFLGCQVPMLMTDQDRLLDKLLKSMFHGMEGAASKVGSDMSGHMSTLHLLAQNWSFGEVVEVGVGGGFSTMSLLAGLVGRGRRLISVDVYLETRAAALRNMGEAPDGDLARAWDFRVKGSVEAAQDFKDGAVSLLFIDSDHSLEYTRRELAAWYPKLHANGVICGHDYYLHEDPAWAMYNVKQAVDEFAELHADRFHLQTLKHDRGFFILWPKSWWNQ